MELALTRSDIMKDFGFFVATHNIYTELDTTLPLRVVPSSAPSPDTDDDDTEDESEEEDQQSEAVCAVWGAWRGGYSPPVLWSSELGQHII